MCQCKLVLCTLLTRLLEDPGDVQSFILHTVVAVYSKTGRSVASPIVATMKNCILGHSNCLMEGYMLTQTVAQEQ